MISPIYTKLDHIEHALRTKGYAVLNPADMPTFALCKSTELEALKVGWNKLPPDTDTGSCCLVVQNTRLLHAVTT